MFSMVFYVVQTLNFGSELRSPRFFGHLVRYLVIAITPRRMHRLGSFFDKMRISSSATSCTKGLSFYFAVFKKLVSKLALYFSQRTG